MPASRVHHQPRPGVPPLQEPIRPQTGTTRLVHVPGKLPRLHGIQADPIGQLPLRTSPRQGVRVPTPLRRRHRPHGLLQRHPTSRHPHHPQRIRAQGHGSSPLLPRHPGHTASGRLSSSSTAVRPGPAGPCRDGRLSAQQHIG